MKKSFYYILTVFMLIVGTLSVRAQSLDQMVAALMESQVTTAGFSAKSDATATNADLIGMLSPVLNNILASSMQESDLTAFASAVFDVSGNCTMDEIYLMMEVTTAAGLGMEGHVVLNYIKDDAGTAYRCNSIWDAENDRISLTYKGGKKLYFTGTVQNAAGRRTSLDATDNPDFAHEGFIYLEGADNETVDIYLHNYRVLSVKDRAWRMTFGYHNLDCTKTEPSIDNSIFALLLQNKLLHGMATPFAIANKTKEDVSDTATPLRVNYHIMGQNLLQGGALSYYTQESMDILSGPAYACVDEIAQNLFGMSMEQLTALFNNLLTMTAAPIAVRPTYDATKGDFNNAAVYLTFDDYWTDGNRTNGELDLPVSTANPGAPSIDYGNALGRVVFNGGQYKLHAPGNDNLFSACNMAICYRTVEMSSDYQAFAQMLNFPGVGSSIGTGRGGDSQAYGNRYKNVIINNGTFSTYDARAFKDVVDVKAKGWYYDYNDLRLPYNSRILGGQFLNCNVYRCNNVVEKGNSPIYVTNDDDIDAQVHDTIALCRDEMNARSIIPGKVISVGTDGTLVQAPEDDPDNKSAVTEFQMYYNGGSYTYGAAELSPIDEEDPEILPIMVYIPSESGYCTAKIEENYITNYVSLIPELGANNRFVELTMGGDVEVQLRNQGDEPRVTGYLFNSLLNPYTVNYGKVNMGTVPIAVYDVLVDKTQDINHLPSGQAKTKGNVDYTISYGLYHMQSFKGNQWALISLPFDVDTIYVMETSAESGNKSWSDEQWEQYYQRQGEADGNVLSRLLSSLFPSIASKAGSGVLQPFVDLVKDQGRAQLFPLIHYNPDLEGYSADDAHYYLYEMQNEGSASLPDVQAWNKKSQWREFSNTDHWLPAYYTDPATAYTDQDGEPVNTRVLMKKGVTYALYLPQGGDRYWDYKYLIFQGRGPQEIQGHRLTDFNSGNPYSVIDDLQYAKNEEGEDLVLIQGNNTFSIDTLTNISAETPVYLATPKLPMSFVFEPYTESTLNILPGEVFAASAGEILKSEMPHHVDQAELTAGSEDMLPHVGNVTLRAWDDNGIVLLSQAKQVVTIYTADGRQLWQKQMRDGEICHVPAGSGIYLLHSGNQSAKLWIK